MTGFRRLRATHRQLLSSAGALALAVWLLLTLRHNQLYVPVFQTFPAADWIELTFGPDEATAYGPAEQLVWRAIPLAHGLTLGVADHTLDTQFGEQHLRRQLAGLESGYSMGIATPREPRTNAGAATRLDGQIEARVFRNQRRAQTYYGMRSFQLDTTRGLTQISPRAGVEEHKVWVDHALLQEKGIAKVYAVGQVGPIAYEVNIIADGEGEYWRENTLDLLDRAQRLTEIIATEWVRLLPPMTP